MKMLCLTLLTVAFTVLTPAATAATEPCEACSGDAGEGEGSCSAMSPPEGVVVDGSLCFNIENKYRNYHDQLCEKYPPPKGYLYQCTTPGTTNTFLCRSSCGMPPEEVGKSLNLDLPQGGGLLANFNNRQQLPASGAGLFDFKTFSNDNNRGIPSFGNFATLGNFPSGGNLFTNTGNGKFSLLSSPLAGRPGSPGFVHNTGPTQGDRVPISGGISGGTPRDEPPPPVKIDASDPALPLKDTSSDSNHEPDLPSANQMPSSSATLDVGSHQQLPPPDTVISDEMAPLQHYRMQDENAAHSPAEGTPTNEMRLLEVVSPDSNTKEGVKKGDNQAPDNYPREQLDPKYPRLSKGSAASHSETGSQSGSAGEHPGQNSANTDTRAESPTEEGPVLQSLPGDTYQIDLISDQLYPGDDPQPAPVRLNASSGTYPGQSQPLQTYPEVDKPLKEAPSPAYPKPPELGEGNPDQQFPTAGPLAGEETVPDMAESSSRSPGQTSSLAQNDEPLSPQETSLPASSVFQDGSVKASSSQDDPDSSSLLDERSAHDEYHQATSGDPASFSYNTPDQGQYYTHSVDSNPNQNPMGEPYLTRTQTGQDVGERSVVVVNENDDNVNAASDESSATSSSQDSTPPGIFDVPPGNGDSGSAQSTSQPNSDHSNDHNVKLPPEAFQNPFNNPAASSYNGRRRDQFESNPAFVGTSLFSEGFLDSPAGSISPQAPTPRGPDAVDLGSYHIFPGFQQFEQTGAMETLGIRNNNKDTNNVFSLLMQPTSQTGRGRPSPEEAFGFFTKSSPSGNTARDNQGFQGFSDGRGEKEKVGGVFSPFFLSNTAKGRNVGRQDEVVFSSVAPAPTFRQGVSPTASGFPATFQAVRSPYRTQQPPTPNFPNTGRSTRLTPPQAQLQVPYYTRQAVGVPQSGFQSQRDQVVNTDGGDSRFVSRNPVVNANAGGSRFVSRNPVVNANAGSSRFVSRNPVVNANAGGSRFVSGNPVVNANAGGSMFVSRNSRPTDFSSVGRGDERSSATRSSGFVGFGSPNAVDPYGFPGSFGSFNDAGFNMGNFKDDNLSPDLFKNRDITTSTMTEDSSSDVKQV